MRQFFRRHTCHANYPDRCRSAVLFSYPALEPDLRETAVAHERYYGYIACTRASERLVITYAHQNAEGKVLNPSPFVAHVKRIFPSLTVEEFSGQPDWRDARHASELIVPLMEIQRFTGADGQSNQSDLAPVSAIKPWRDLCSLPVLKTLAENLAVLREPDQSENLSPVLAEKLYGPVLRSSVSRLEEFAACPFRFFVRSGLRAGERKVFELDARERGNFQHDVLKMFHEQLKAEGRRWRDLEPAEARERIGKIAAAQTEHFRDGLFRDSAETIFAARTLTESLKDFVAVIVAWMHTQYEFDPAEAELGFGGKADRASAWEIDFPGGHKLALQGRIDRVDLWRDPSGDATMAVVTDYKSGGKNWKKSWSKTVCNCNYSHIWERCGTGKTPRKFLDMVKSSPPGRFMSICAANTRAVVPAMKFSQLLLNRGVRPIATPADLTRACSTAETVRLKGTCSHLSHTKPH